MAADASRFLEMIVDGLGCFGRRPAVGLRGEFGVRWRTYQELQRDVWKIANWFADERIGRGDRILLWSSNSPEWVACLLGALLRGVVVVPVDATASPEFITRIAADCAAKIAFHAAALDARFLRIPTKQLESQEDQPSSNLGPLHVSVAPDDPAVVIYTSGTTSAPRGVVLTHGNIHAQIERFGWWRTLLRMMPFRMLVIAPLSHVQGLLLGGFLPLSIGLSVVFVQSVHPAHLLRTIRDNRVTLFSTVPRVLTVLTRAVEAQAYKAGTITLGQRLQSVRRGWVRRHVLFMEVNRTIGLHFWVILVGGATLSRQDEQFWRDTGRFVIQGYGLTETTGLVALNGPFSRSVGSIGRELKHVSLQIAEDGELLVRGPNVSPSCAGNGGGQDDCVLHDGDYLRTGDLVRRAGRRLYFVGRKKEVVVTSEGFNVYPADVENALSRTDGVIDSVVFAKGGDEGSEVHAVLLLRPDTDPAQAVQDANRLLMLEQRIRSWTRWPDSDFPRTALFKVRREAVRVRIQNIDKHATRGMQNQPPGPLTADGIASEPDRQTRVALLARYLTEGPRDKVREDQSQLAMDFGLSSLDFVELLARLEEMQGRKLNHARLVQNATISSVHAELGGEPARKRAGSRLPSHQPGWAKWPLCTALRAIVRPSTVALWSQLCASCSSPSRAVLDKLVPPFFLAAAPHRHWLDAFAVSAVLPERLARRILIVTNRDFSEFFDPDATTSRADRIAVALGYHFGLPLTYPFTIVPHYGATREGLFETMRWVDKGYCPLVFPKGILVGETDQNRHDLGPAVLAIEAGIPIIPVWIRGNENLSFRLKAKTSRVQVLFGPQVRARIGNEPEEIRGRVEAAWRALAAMEES